MVLDSERNDECTKKNDGKRVFLRKTSFRLNRFFYMVGIQRLITVNT